MLAVGVKSSYIIHLLYINDMLVVRSNIQYINKVKTRLSIKFEIKDFKVAKQIIGMNIVRYKAIGNLKLSQ